MIAPRVAASHFTTIAALLLAAPLALAQPAAPATDTTTGRPATPAVPAPATVPTVTHRPLPRCRAMLSYLPSLPSLRAPW